MDSQAITGHRTRRGFNLIESAIVLGVAGLIIGGIWVAATSFYESYKVNKTVEGIFSISRNIQELISIRDAQAIGFLGMNTLAKKAGVFPEDWINGSAIKEPFGSNVSVVNFIYAGGEPVFFITFNYPQSACIKILAKISNASALSVNGVLNFETKNFPISLTTAKTACNLSVNIVAISYNYTRIN